MLRLTNLADYAVVVMVAAARQSASGRSQQLAVPAIACLTGLSTATAGKLMNLLGKAGLLESTRGVGGGFRLARPPADITLAEIVEAIDGPIGLTSCVQDEGCGCQIGPSCQVRPRWPLINRLVRDVLARVTLAQMAEDEADGFVGSGMAVTLGRSTELGATSDQDIGVMN
jgi:FeS assembly SUF system regulator